MVYAPIEIGQKVGQIEYYYSQFLVCKKDIYAAGRVEMKFIKPSFGLKFYDCLISLIKVLV